MGAILAGTLLLFLLLVAALTAASEIAIITASRLKLRRLSASGSKTAKAILKILDAPEKFFSTILVANNIVDTLIAAIVTVIMIGLVGKEGHGVIIATILVAFLITVSEVVAKTFAARHSEKLAMIFAKPVGWLIVVFSPVVKVLATVTNVIVRFIGGEPAEKKTLITEEEIRGLLKIGEEEGVLHKEKYKMLSKVFEFGETVARSVMTPKKDMVAIDINSKFEDMLEKVVESGYSRLPVYKDNPENIVGVINMKDLLNLSCNRGLVVLQDIIYPATLAPGSKKVTDLLREFQKGHTHLAIITDDRGGLEGLVTLEDLLEEIVGEIEDEYDVRAPNASKPTKNDQKI